VIRGEPSARRETEFPQDWHSQTLSLGTRSSRKDRLRVHFKIRVHLRPFGVRSPCFLKDKRDERLHPGFVAEVALSEVGGQNFFFRAQLEPYAEETDEEE